MRRQTAAAIGVPDVGVLVLTTWESDGDSLRAVQAGAKGYLLNDTPRTCWLPDGNDPA